MKVRDLIARLSALRVAGLLDEWGEELAGTLERQAARGQGPTERQRFAAVASRAAFSKRGQRSNVFFKDQHEIARERLSEIEAASERHNHLPKCSLLWKSVSADCFRRIASGSCLVLCIASRARLSTLDIG